MAFEELNHFVDYLMIVDRNANHSDDIDNFVISLINTIVDSKKLTYEQSFKKIKKPEEVLSFVKKDFLLEHEMTIKEYEYLSNMLLARFRFSNFIISEIIKENIL